MARSRWGTLGVLLIFLFQQSTPLYAWPRACKSIGDVYVSKDLMREPLPVIKVHSKTQMPGFQRFYVSSQNARLPWKYSYIDYYEPRELVFEVRFDSTNQIHLERTTIRGSPSNPAKLTPLTDEALEALVNIFLHGTNAQVTKVLRQFTNQKGWEAHLAKAYWVRDYLEFEMIRTNTGLLIMLKPSIGKFVVHRASLKPVTVDPWRIPDANVSVEGGMRPLRKMLGITDVGMEREPLHHLYWRILKNPHWFLSLARQTVDASFFYFFLPYVLAVNWVQGNVPWKQYRPARAVVASWWLMILLAELLFYTPASYSFSADENPETVWSGVWAGDDIITDAYATRAQWGFEKEGITVLWSGLGQDVLYDRIGSWGNEQLARFRYRGWNAVVVSYGLPRKEELPFFDRVELSNAQATKLADVFVHKKEALIYYHFGDRANRLPAGGLASVFKALLPIIRSVGCEGQPESCGIKNLVVNTHGNTGVLNNVLDFFELPLESEVRYSCDLAEKCRGVPMPERQVLTQAMISGLVMNGAQFVFMSCGVAGGERGKQAIELFADYFQLKPKKGRVVAARKVVAPLFSFFPFLEDDPPVEEPTPPVEEPPAEEPTPPETSPAPPVEEPPVAEPPTEPPAVEPAPPVEPEPPVAPEPAPPVESAPEPEPAPPVEPAPPIVPEPPVEPVPPEPPVVEPPAPPVEPPAPPVEPPAPPVEPPPEPVPEPPPPVVPPPVGPPVPPPVRPPVPEPPKVEDRMNPYVWIRKALAFKVTAEARKYNQWDAIDLAKGSLLFGPFTAYKAGKKLLLDRSFSCNDCVLDLDYRD